MGESAARSRHRLRAPPQPLLASPLPRSMRMRSCMQCLRLFRADQGKPAWNREGIRAPFDALHRAVMQSLRRSAIQSHRSPSPSHMRSACIHRWGDVARSRASSLNRKDPVHKLSPGRERPAQTMAIRARRSVRLGCDRCWMAADRADKRNRRQARTCARRSCRRTRCTQWSRAFPLRRTSTGATRE